MQSVLESALECVVGAVEIVPGRSGAVLLRAPARARARLRDAVLDHSSATPSGIRFELSTDATVLELELALRHVVLLDERSGGTTVDLVVDGVLRDPVHTTEETLVVVTDLTTQDVEVRRSGPATLRFELGATPAERRVEIWLPTTSAVLVRDVRIPAGAVLRPAPASGPAWVHHGSSISQCAEADRPTGTWPAIVARAAGRSLVNLGLGGQCHLDPFMARTIRDLPAAAISLELGINVVNGDTMRERVFVPAFHGFLDTVRDGHPETPVLVVSPIVCPVAEDHPGPTVGGPDRRVRVVPRPADLATGALSLTRIRTLLAEHVALRQAEGDANLHLLDGLELFGHGDAPDLPDGLHPDAAGYRRMAERFLPVAFGPGGALERSSGTPDAG
jgi:hypothetical protein